MTGVTSSDTNRLIIIGAANAEFAKLVRAVNVAIPTWELIGYLGRRRPQTGPDIARRSRARTRRRPSPPGVCRCPCHCLDRRGAYPDGDGPAAGGPQGTPGHARTPRRGYLGSDPRTRRGRLRRGRALSERTHQRPRRDQFPRGHRARRPDRILLYDRAGGRGGRSMPRGRRRLHRLGGRCSFPAWRWETWRRSARGPW